ncbi:hypothetical protein [Streptomyces sp. NBC_00483]|uniref:hypothetical protein n=1 Tax=Streptomyces sp. NBC_00483 TaxID=2975756 RepID=UPI002E191A5D
MTYTPVTTNPPSLNTTSVVPKEHRSPGARSPGDNIRAVPAVLRSEWLKVSSLRSHQAVLALTTLVGAFVSWAVATFVTDEVLTATEVFTYSTVLTAVVASVAGVLLFTSEAQHGTLSATLTAQPARWVVALAKTVTAAAYGLVLGAAGMAAGLGGALVSGLDLGDTSGMAVTTLWALLYTALAAVLGLGIGMIVRHGAAAISGLLVWGFVVENLLNLFMSPQISRFLPFIAGDALLAIDSDTATAESVAVALTRTQDALVFGGYAVVALIIGTFLLHRRDTN